MFKIPENTAKYIFHEIIKKYSDDSKKDLVSEAKTDYIIVFKDKDGVYPEGKIIASNKFVTMYDYNYIKDNDGNVISCIIEKSVHKNGKLLDIEKTGEKKYFDKKGNLVKVELSTREGIIYSTLTYEYDSDNNVILEKAKGTHTVRTKTFYRGEVKCITETTIQSKMTHTPYKAFFDNDGRIYKVIDGDKSVEINYERDFDAEGNILSETKRYFDISTTTKKLISYEVKSYIPAANYKIGKVIKNGILTEEHTYNLKGEEIALFKLEDNKEYFTRIQKTVDTDNGNITTISTTLISDYSDNTVKNKVVKRTVDKDNKLLLYSEDNSIVSTYEYDDEGRRTSVITKKLVGEEFVVINEILYTYTTDPETLETIRTRELTIFDIKGEPIAKTIHEESFDSLSDTYTEEKILFNLEQEED